MRERGTQGIFVVWLGFGGLQWNFKEINMGSFALTLS